MPTRLHLTFPGSYGDKDITFVCDSGDYDHHGSELTRAILQVNRLLEYNGPDDPGASLTLEDC